MKPFVLLLLVLGVGCFRTGEGGKESSAEFQFVGVNERGLREFKHHRTGIVFVEVPGGEVVMSAEALRVRLKAFVSNSESPESVRFIERLEAAVTRSVKAFLISKAELTWPEWERLSGFPQDSGRRGAAVDLDEASLRRALEDCGLRMVRDYEWEYVFRGVEDFVAPDSPKVTNSVDWREVLRGAEGGYEAKVEELRKASGWANEYGILGMDAGLPELCQAVFHGDSKEPVRVESRAVLDSGVVVARPRVVTAHVEESSRIWQYIEVFDQSSDVSGARHHLPIAVRLAVDPPPNLSESSRTAGGD